MQNTQNPILQKNLSTLNIVYPKNSIPLIKKPKLHIATSNTNIPYAVYNGKNLHSKYDPKRDPYKY